MRWGSHSSVADNSSLPGCCVGSVCKWALAFQRVIVHSCLGSGWMELINITIVHHSRRLEFSCPHVIACTSVSECDFTQTVTCFSTNVTLQFTPWSRVLPEKLTVPQLLKKFPTFYRTWRFNTAFTRACHLSLSWARSIQSMQSHPTFRRLSSQLYWSFQVSSFSQVSPPKPSMHISSSPYMLHALPISVFLIWSPELYLVRSTEHKAACYKCHICTNIFIKMSVTVLGQVNVVRWRQSTTVTVALSHFSYLTNKEDEMLQGIYFVKNFK